jgi:hypothetical protein
MIITYNGFDLEYIGYGTSSSTKRKNIPTFRFKYESQFIALYRIENEWRIGIDSKGIKENKIYKWLKKIEPRNSEEANNFAKYLFEKSALRLELLFIIKS